MNLAVLGARTIGSTLGRKWAAAGHTITFGVRNVDNPEVRDMAMRIGAAVATTADAIAAGDIVVFAIPGGAMEETVIRHAAALDTKIVIDAANRMGAGDMNSIALFTAHAPHARVFRAFNSLGWENFENPMFDDVQADLFYCGPDGDADQAVAQMIRDIGLRPIRVGDIAQVHLVDMVASLWFSLAQGRKMGRNLAFKVLTRP